MSLKPTSDRVIVKPTSVSEKSAGGIFIPPTAIEKPQEGVVVAVGPGRTENGIRVPMDVHVGDTILFGKFTGTEINYDGSTIHIIMHESDIVAIKK